jgi:hypothetical protein
LRKPNLASGATDMRLRNQCVQRYKEIRSIEDNFMG